MKPVIKKRQPALGSLEDARALLMAAGASAAHPMTKLASRLFGPTTLRPGTLRIIDGAELEALNEDSPVWRIPADRMKLKRARAQDDRFDFLVPRSRQAMDGLRAARAFKPRGPLVFPSQRHTHKPLPADVVSFGASSKARTLSWSGKTPAHTSASHRTPIEVVNREIIKGSCHTG